MIITCQNCQTHYSVDVGLVGGGKTVRCENCGNSWHQHPQQAAPPPPVAPVAPVAAPVYAAPPPPPQPPFEPAPEPAPVPEPEPMPEPEATPEADAAAEIAAMEEEAAAEEPAVAAGGEDGGEEAGDTAEVAGADSDALSPDQLDEMFGEDTEPEAIESLTGSDGDAEDEPIDLEELENLPDPDPIPGVFSTGDDDLIEDGPKKKGMGKIIGIAVLALVIGLGAGAFFGRSMIIELWPGAADIYAMVGLDGEELGTGLVIQDVKSSRQVESGVDVLVIRGTIANVSEEEHMVPMIRVALFDANDDEVQHVVAAPLKNRLQAGTEVGFSAKLPEPSALGRRVVVTFMEAKK